MVVDNSGGKNVKKQDPATGIDPHIRKEILDAIESVSFGEVVVTIHEKRVVQIEKKEKRRL